MRELSQQTSDLIRKEMELARAELRVKGKAAGIGAGMFGGAGLVALFGFGALTTCLVLALATGVAAWLAALIVAVVYFAIAGAAALVGRGQVQQATPPAPEQAIASTKEDVEWTKQRAKTARQ
ncbi:MAG: phage holin family protein [Actinomycetota bacterium]|nr:phage holin family protein [Actinomycetota bacterium]